VKRNEIEVSKIKIFRPQETNDFNNSTIPSDSKLFANDSICTKRYTIILIHILVHGAFFRKRIRKSSTS
jgi:hypothetical protein